MIASALKSFTCATRTFYKRWHLAAHSWHGNDHLKPGTVLLLLQHPFVVRAVLALHSSEPAAFSIGYTSPPRKTMRCRNSRPKGSPAMSCVLQSVQAVVHERLLIRVHVEGEAVTALDQHTRSSGGPVTHAPRRKHRLLHRCDTSAAAPPGWLLRCLAALQPYRRTLCGAEGSECGRLPPAEAARGGARAWAGCEPPSYRHRFRTPKPTSCVFSALGTSLGRVQQPGSPQGLPSGPKTWLRWWPMHMHKARASSVQVGGIKDYL